MSDALITTPAILLRAVATGEADRVVTLLGRETGRVSAIARGARKSVRRFVVRSAFGRFWNSESAPFSGIEIRLTNSETPKFSSFRR